MPRDRDRAREARRRRKEGDDVAGLPPRDGSATGLPPDDQSPGIDPVSGDHRSPDPLAHASSEVDEARDAISGGGVSPGDPYGPGHDGHDGGPPRIDPDVLEAGGSPGRGNRAIGFIRNSWAELQRVQWPDRPQVLSATAVVLGFVVLAGGYLGLLDALFKPLVNAIL